MFSYNKEDYLIRQIQNIAHALAKLFFGSDKITYEIKDETNYTQSDLIYLKINKLMVQHDYQKAQAILIDNLDPNDDQYLKLILYFYNHLDSMSDDELTKYHLNRQEITNIFLDLTSKYNCLI